MLGKTERRVALVILVTALLPLASAMVLAYWLLNYASSVWLRPEVEHELERGIELYKEYIGAVKDDLKNQTAAIAGDDQLRDAARRRDTAACQQALDRLFPGYAHLVSLAVEGETDGATIAQQDRGRPLDEGIERRLEVRRPLGADGAGPTLVATFAFDRRYERELEEAGSVHDAYAQLQRERARVYAGYYEAFAVLLGITVVATVALGFLLARGITRRISLIAAAIGEVTAGDLDVRVPVTGSDELTELARVFNRMLREMQQSRARIEYLQRIGAWQEMAQRLAHEIKNPLTPIQLAVQECHRKYDGHDGRFRALLDTTLEIVEEEVGTLRRLVGNFSSFARLPQAELREASLRDFLRECSEQLGHLSVERPEDGADELIEGHDVEIRWEIPDDETLVAIDRQMLKRVLVNLVRNAVEAIRDARPARGDSEPRGHVLVRAERIADGVALIVEDDGPGVPEPTRERVFDPYFTTKLEGTGLGLAIVKKVVVEHNGAITVARGVRLGGAAFVVALPPAHSLAIAVARDADAEPRGLGPAVTGRARPQG
ncbi:MAG TPA: ATP-binding protein, partial [Polyangiaceae bacterium]|nr:ATP-binding protein [Polyangiaceae bacterium]